MTSNKDDLFSPWFVENTCDNENVLVLTERQGGQNEIFDDLVSITADHIVDLAVIKKMGGFPKAKRALLHRLPQRKKDRSADLGEILATEYVNRKTDYDVPVRRLRYKDDRGSAMRGDDVLGFRKRRTRIQVKKVEAKSRARLTPSVIGEARDGLKKYRGRPNPSTLAFIEYVLRKENRDDEAELLAELQEITIQAKDINHLIFTFSGNNPTSQLSGGSKQIQRGIELELRGCHVASHGEFIAKVFDTCLALGDSDGNN